MACINKVTLKGGGFSIRANCSPVMSSCKEMFVNKSLTQAYCENKDKHRVAYTWGRRLSCVILQFGVGHQSRA